MKLKLWSDLHLEFSKHQFNHIWTPSEDDKETILLLAGDIDIGLNGQEFITVMCQNFRHVIRICGNHEFYGKEFNKIIEGWKKFEEEGPENFHFLHNDWRIIDNVRIIGGTMWTGLNNGDPLIVYTVGTGLNDYNTIRHEYRKIRPDFTMAQHRAFVKFLNEKLAEDFDGKTVVVTHHSPGDKTRSAYHGGDLDYAYYACLEDMLNAQEKIALWVHGHTHISQDYTVNKTRIVCNPFGYYGYDINPKFNKDLILEV